MRVCCEVILNLFNSDKGNIDTLHWEDEIVQLFNPLSASTPQDAWFPVASLLTAIVILHGKIRVTYLP
jgi:hypothetical protein